MMFLTHLLFGIFSGYLAQGFLGYGSSSLFVTVAAAASLLPDIDHVSSWIGRRLPPLSITLSLLFSHRGFLHSLIVPVLLYFMIAAASKEMASAVLVGYVSHIMLDATTTKGIRPLHPLPFKIRGVIRTNGFAEKIIMLLLMVIIVLFAFYSMN